MVYFEIVNVIEFTDVILMLGSDFVEICPLQASLHIIISNTHVSLGCSKSFEQKSNLSKPPNGNRVMEMQENRD